jgi:hypothetical protein
MVEMDAYQATMPAQRDEVEAKIWALAQRHGVFGYGEIIAELSLSERVVRDIVLGWVAAGRVTERPAGKRHRKMFALPEHHREPKDRTSIVAQQLWTAMRGLKTFGPRDLASHCREDLAVQLPEASAYAQSMLRGGYLKVVQTASPGKREATYKLVRNTGPRPPREKRVQAIWDPNEATYAYVAGVGRIGGGK